MPKKLVYFLVSVSLVLTELFLPVNISVHADTVWPQPCIDNNKTGQACVDFLSGTVSDLQGQEKTLSSQIAVMNGQINLTQARIYATEQQISDLTLDIDTTSKKIDDLQTSVDAQTKALMGKVVATYEVGTIQPMQVLLTSSNVADFLKRLNYLKIAQEHDKKALYNMQQAKNDYQNQKNIFQDKKAKVEALKAQLDAYTQQLNQEKAQKQQLLAQTQGSEATYKTLLSQALAQLAALSGYGISASGGVSIIPHEELSDGWGRYFNQRDANWGNILINGQSSGCGLNNKAPCTIWMVGCLITSYAMVADHFGASMTPADVATSGNFSVGTAYFNKPGPSANGHSASYVSDPSLSSLVDAVRSGKVVIAGLSMNGGSVSAGYWSDHWVVLRSVDAGGNFMINDPEYQGAMNVPLSDHYGSWKIIEARIYQ